MPAARASSSRTRSARRRLRAATAALAAVALAGSLAACTAQNDDLVDAYREGDTSGFVSRDFAATEIALDARDEAIVFSGTGVDGSTITSDDMLGDVVVVNFWYAGCGPCRAEAPFLQEANEEFADADVSFLGVNIYDEAATAESFDRTYGITYPSVLAHRDPDLKLAFAEVTSLQAVPTTLVLDAEGRLAARIIGQLSDASILTTLVRDTLAETP
ncbi:TlpA disulfide reductase family protein [Microbacterium sp. zg.Y1084]|uniref:TlpA family protein disulfide reductase n=1 Tax=Microbacterium sp. zg.Y1084 TaxID=2969667 RepID=UPI00214B2497|nr:TlpA disulfide reductase family protein [Microbacterium sp. zg.Y1084]MCR2812535.1 TlpA family protein disulfide reductase [Microbacterium sp. zg.Y1084]